MPTAMRQTISQAAQQDAVGEGEGQDQDRAGAGHEAGGHRQQAAMARFRRRG